MRDNRGVTLVELLVAIAVGAIVLSGVTYLIVYSLRLYGNGSATADLANEAQSTLNYIVDTTMQSKGIVLEYDDTTHETSCMLYGEIEYNTTLGRWTYQGAALVTDVAGAHEIYLAEFPNAGYPKEAGENYCKLNAADAANVSEAAEEIADYVLNSDANRKAGLLASGIYQCCIYLEDPMSALVDVTDPYTGVTETQYTQPFTVAIQLEFRTPTATGTTSKSVQDNASVRNSIGTIYINRNEYGPKLK